MSVCLKEEVLQAFMDQELGEPENDCVSAHVAGCAACRGKLALIQSSSLKLKSILDSLVPDGHSVASLNTVIDLPQPASAPTIAWTGVAAGAAIAAVILVAFIFLRSGPVVPGSRDIAIVSHTSAAVKSTGDQPTPIIHAPVPVRKQKPQPRILQFHALDNGGTFESGLVYRVSLPVPIIAVPGGARPTKTIPAEVMVDESGQVRAIRFLQ
jgi:hypothetical protein